VSQLSAYNRKKIAIGGMKEKEFLTAHQIGDEVSNPSL